MRRAPGGPDLAAAGTARPVVALAEAFLAPLHAAGLPEREAARAYRLIYDYTLGFALSDRTTTSEQR
ncbi:MAG TPA: TetR/AcrR family transcriptional regulator C-terminal domain-containing protein, partial [Streptosporangiaceae bacterium]